MDSSPAHHLPQFHIRTPGGYLNDPNGPIEFGDRVHLYFQSRSTTDLATPVQWGHATSADLVHWTLHRPAMGPIPGGPDADGCYSGNTVVDGDRLRVFYSGKLAHSPYQSVLTAVSSDGGMTFGAPSLAVEDPHPDEDVAMFRDPFVYPDGDGWSMAVGCALRDGTAMIRHYRSSDLHGWTYSGPLRKLTRTTIDGVDSGEGWECPQILDVAGGPVAVVCSWSFDGGIGPLLSMPLSADRPPTVVDHGHNLYAASAMLHGSDAPLLFGWITEGRGDAWWHEAGWAGALSLPRVVWLDADARLCSIPYRGVDALRLGTDRPANGATVGARMEIAVPAVSGYVRLRFSAEEFFDVTLDLAKDTVEIDREHASSDQRAHRGTGIAPRAFDSESDRPGTRIFVDGSVVEVFTQSGRSLTTRVYPLTPPPWTIEAPAGAVVWDLDATLSVATGDR